MRKLMFMTFACLTTPAWADQPLEWARQLGTPAADVAVSCGTDGDGNVYASGLASAALPGQSYSGGTSDGLVVRYDADGTLAWTRELGTSADDLAHVAVHATGVYVLLVTDTVELRQYDFDGNELWSRVVATSGFGGAHDLAAHASGVYWATGGSSGASIRKFDFNGNELWARAQPTVGEYDAISLDATHVYAFGLTHVLPSPVVLHKYDLDGNLVWDRLFSSTVQASADGVSAHSSGIYISGRIDWAAFPGQTSAGSSDAYVAKYDAAGNLLWIRQFGSGGVDVAEAVAADASGLYAGVSWGDGDIRIVKFDFDGTELWSQQFRSPGFDRVQAVCASHVGVYAAGRAGGPFQGQTAFGDVDAFVLKLAPALFADAGSDQSANEGTQVCLDGLRSTGRSLSFSWQQLAPPDCLAALNDPTSTTPCFTAPQLPGGVSGSCTLTFELTVTDTDGASDTDTVDVTVKNVNNPPVPGPGPDQTVNEGSVVTLDGGVSYDPDGDVIACQWSQTCGTAVNLADPSSCTASFTAPVLSGGSGDPETLCFTVTVSDGELSTTSSPVTITVEQVNHRPTADAGPDQTRAEGSLVRLDGTGSSDPDEDALSYAWSQTCGPAVSLADAVSATPSFTAPEVDPGGATLCFRLVVSDGLTSSEPPDEVVITVQNVNDPPRCDLASPSAPTLWPPNHKMVSVGIIGVTDPNNDAVTITITAVTQDEPTNGLGDGDTSPDAVFQGSTTLLRAERSGTGNGRVYRVSFTADDGQGGVCSGSLAVGVPLSMRPGAGAVDDGQTHDSTQP